MGSTIFFIVGGFFSFGSCIGLEDCAPVVFSVVLSWLGGFFYGGFFCGGCVIFSYALWWLGGCFYDALVFFLLLMALALPPLVFSTFLEVVRD
jgi:hypothetical protein